MRHLFVAALADFAAAYSALFYRSAVPGPAAIASTLSFTPALPSGARLIAIDLDASAETFTLTSGGTPLSLLEQRETNAGATSVFPSYAVGTGVLSTIVGGPNDSEATVFDVSGLATIDVDFAGGNLGSGSFIVIALPIQKVPALGPAWGVALVLGLIAVALRRVKPAGARLTLAEP